MSNVDAADPGVAIFGPAQLAELTPFGTERAVEAGEVLFRPGDESYDFYVLLDGEAAIFRPAEEGDVLIVRHTAGGFLGELSLVTGQRPYLLARMMSDGRVLAVPPVQFRRLMSEKPTLADTIFRTLVARRERLREGDGAQAIRIVGSRYSAEAQALRAYATRAHLVFTWIDLEDAEDVGALLASMGLRPSDTPVVITTTARLVRPTPGQFAEHLGLTYHAAPGYLFDLVVVGSGPAGLAASVYGASEGLTTLSLDSLGVGGQAGTSSRIENYVGFPNGVSGEDLANAAAVQAQRLGARLNSPCEVAAMRIDEGFHVLTLVDGSEVPCRAVIVASGARYQRLAVGDLERWEGAGVYYAATDLEARSCASSDVIVVGGGNSAGQAAIYLAQHDCRVTVAIRRDDLAATMSRYLIDRIEADPNIEIAAATEVKALHGDGRLRAVTLEHGPTGERRDVACNGLFCFIGAVPATQWLRGLVELDSAGFVLTDRSLPDEVTTGPAFAVRPPLPFETSVPGVFAAGDVRKGSLKRVAAAVGEGSSAVRSVHEHLAVVGARPRRA